MSRFDTPTGRMRLLDIALPLGLALAGAILAPQGTKLAAAAIAGFAGVSIRISVHEPVETHNVVEHPSPSEGAYDIALLTTFPVPMLLIDEAGVVRSASDEAERLLARDLEGLPISSIFRAPTVVSAVEEAISGGKEDTFDFRMRRPRELTLTATVRPLPGSEGLRAAMILRDSTGQVQVDATRSDFVANASHELRTPLAAISGIVETLRGSARDDPEAQERFLGIIAKQIDRMTRLVSDLLSLSRVELQENVAPTERQNLRGILAEVISAARPMAEELGVEVDAPLPDDLPKVFGSRDELAQVFVNLIDNAIHYGNSRVTIEAETLDDTVGITVSDDGPGIEGHHIPRLTERFYRADAGGARGRHGTGLGLAIVKHIVSRHRGTLGIVSEPGAGSRFTIALPIADE